MNARRLLLLAGVIWLSAAWVGVAAESESGDDEFKATCPVSGKPAIESSSVKLPDGKGEVYFCCENCPKAYKADSDKFELKVLRQQLETGQIVQVACPVSGQELDDAQKVEVGEAEVAFCCEHCLAKFEEAEGEEEKLKVVFGDFENGFTRQTKCPVSGQPINPEHSVEHDGKKVYFCCPNCPAAFEADPEKFISGGEAKAPLPQFEEDNEAG